MIWKECPVLKKTGELIRKHGGVPIKMLLTEDGPNRVAVIVSHDPSGPNRRMELHASVSASTDGIRREPTGEEVIAVGNHLRLKSWENSKSEDKLVSHLWSPL